MDEMAMKSDVYNVFDFYTLQKLVESNNEIHDHIGASNKEVINSDTAWNDAWNFIKLNISKENLEAFVEACKITLPIIREAGIMYTNSLSNVSYDKDTKEIR